MKKRLGVVMDAIASIHYQKDSTLAMLWEAQARGYELFYFEIDNLFLKDGIAYGMARRLTVQQDPQHYFSLETMQASMPLAELHVILMRKDPPFNQSYLYATYLLEAAERQGALVVNRPQSLRDCNEKLYATHFPACIPPTLVTNSLEQLKEFWQAEGEIVCKPLNAMGGASVFRLGKAEVNANAIFTAMILENDYVMAQKFIADIKQGDKRILMINGEAVPYALARVPQDGDWRGNLAVGAKGMVQALSARDRFICTQVAPDLIARGLYFVGLDIIGEYLTEINVTSPTGIREIEAQTKLNISEKLFDVIEAKLRLK